LATYKSEACSQLQQKSSDMTDQGIFDVSLVGFIAKTKKIKVLRVFENLRRKTRIGWIKTLIEIIKSRSLA
jgi:hypothetical protein